MSVYIKLILSTFLILGLQACSKEEEQVNPNYEKKITVKVFYCTQEKPNDQKPDAGSKVYIYYDLYTIDFRNSTYQGNGKFIEKSSVIEPEQNYLVNLDGTIDIVPIYSDRKISVIVESNYYKGRLASSSYMKFDESIVCTNIFHP